MHIIAHVILALTVDQLLTAFEEAGGSTITSLASKAETSRREVNRRFCSSSLAFEEGQEEMLQALCDELLASPETIDTAYDKLKFDGAQHRISLDRVFSKAKGEDLRSIPTTTRRKWEVIRLRWVTGWKSNSGKVTEFDVVFKPIIVVGVVNAGLPPLQIQI